MTPSIREVWCVFFATLVFVGRPTNSYNQSRPRTTDCTESGDQVVNQVTGKNTVRKMKAILFLVAIICVAVAPLPWDEHESKSLFAHFKTQYKKEYATIKEEQLRYRIFSVLSFDQLVRMFGRVTCETCDSLILTLYLRSV